MVFVSDKVAPVSPADAPRIAPGTREEVGRLNFGLARLIGAATGGGPPNVFTTLARHRTLFRPWLRFAGALMPGGRLPREQTELLILRTAHNCGCEYEWHHHERLGREAGLSADDIERVRSGPSANGWGEEQALLLRAADELHERRTISDELWSELRSGRKDHELIEICMLVGHYEMLAGTINAVGIQPDAPPPARPSLGVRVVQAVAKRRTRPRGRNT
jgi:alkylhydroperoxidase family enzyme